MKVAVLIPRRSGGGAEFVALQWADYLRRDGHTVVVVTTHGTAEEPSPDVHPLGATNLAARVRELRAHLDRADYDVVLALMPHWNLLALMAGLGRRSGPAIVISGRNVEASLRGSQGRGYRAELALSRLLYPRCDAYVAISHPVAAEAAGRYGIDVERIWVVPNPATAKTTPGSSRRRHYLDDGGQPRVTLTVPARLVRQKRPELAVRTAAVLRSRYAVEARVEFFGHGPEEALVRDYAEQLQVEVTFRGWVTSWFEEAAEDAVVLLPSSAEGFANVLVEAAAAGIPSVASSRALGVADAIVSNVTGVLTLGSDPAEYADAVLLAMTLRPE
ncbi:MAG: hypothetical protein JWP61_1586, partial [Friedmanniella sp.]|nr:hypothetical protein [Friedmanniella sp.]